MVFYQAGGGSTPLVYDATGRIIGSTQHFYVLVFDQDRIVARHEFFAASFNSEDEAFRFTDGNRAIIFRASQGFKQYDVATDALADLGPQGNATPTGSLP